MKGKGLNFKAFAIAHGEKVAIGVVGVMVLAILAGSTWGTYKKTPDQLTDKATAAREAVKRSIWPDAEQAKYPIDDRLKVKIDSMLSPIPGDKVRLPDGSAGLALTIVPSFDLYIKERPWTTPTYLPVRHLQAVPFRAVIAKLSEDFVSTDGTDPMGSGTDVGPMGSSTTGRKFKDLGGGTGGTGPGNPMGGRLGPGSLNNSGGGAGLSPMGSSTGGAKQSGTKYTPNYSSTGGGKSTPGAPGGVPGMEEGGTGGFGGQQREAEGHRAIAVVGVFPILEQARAFEKARNEPESIDARLRVKFASFVIERRSSADEGKNWDGWQKIERQTITDFFKKVANFDTDVVHQGVTDGEITMQLPERLLSYWGDEATHPDIEKFKLSDRGRKIQAAIDEETRKLTEHNKKLYEVNPHSMFGPSVMNLAPGRQAVMNSSEMTQKLMTTMTKSFGSTEMDPRQLQTEIANEVTASGELVLFRYFDFDVQPGLEYQYRVRLLLFNPLYGVPPEKLALDSLEANKDEFRETPVSNLTNIVKMDRDTNYFITRINDKPSVHYHEPSVDFLFYQWFPKPGVTVKGEVKKILVGQRLVGNDKKTKRLDLAKGKLEVNVESDFSSTDVLLDTTRSHTTLDPEHMRILGLERNLSGLIPVPAKVLVVNAQGQLRQYDPLTDRGIELDSARDHEALMAYYKHLEFDPSLVDTGNGLDEGSSTPMEGGAGGSSLMRKSVRKQSPNRRKQYGSGGGSSGGPGYGGAPGYGGGTTKRPTNNRGPLRGGN